MANNKIKFPLWLTPECKQIVEDNYHEDQYQSRSEFIEKAIWFYAGFLHTLEAGAYLPRALKQMLDGTLGVFARAHRAAAFQTGGRAERQQSHPRFGYRH